MASSTPPLPETMIPTSLAPSELAAQPTVGSGSTSVPPSPTKPTASPLQPFATGTESRSPYNPHLPYDPADLPPLPSPLAFATNNAAPSTSSGESLNPSHVPPMISFDPKSGTPSDEEDDDDEDGAGGSGARAKKRKSMVDLRKGTNGASGASGSKIIDEDDKGRRKIQIEYIEEKSKRHITFSKRKAGIMKKAYELSTLTGTQVLLLVVSESGWVYTFTTEKFKPIVKEDENGQLSQGQKLIAQCLENKPPPVQHGPGGYSPPLVNQPATNPNFEANSSIHGGQIALKTNNRGNRPVASNRRVYSKGRMIPPAIRTDAGVPSVLQLPTPMSGGALSSPGSGYMDPHQRSPMRGPQSLQQQQQQSMEYGEMLHRAEMLQMQPGSYEHGPPPQHEGGPVVYHPQSHGGYPYPSVHHHPHHQLPPQHSPRDNQFPPHRNYHPQHEYGGPPPPPPQGMPVPYHHNQHEQEMDERSYLPLPRHER